MNVTKKFVVKHSILFMLLGYFLLLLCTGLTTAIANDEEPYPKTPEKVVEEYCKKDSRGVRVGKHGGWDNVREYVSWDDEPGWDGATIIRKYNISKLHEGRDTARISVTYWILGETDGLSWKPGRKKRTVVFTLKRDNGRWRINEPMISPYISLDTAIQVLEETTKDVYDKNATRALEQLRTIKKGG